MQRHTYLHLCIVLPLYCWSQNLQAARASTDNIFFQPITVTRGNTPEGSISGSSVEASTTFSLVTSCSDESEILIENEDIRIELMAINMQYLENGSTLKACQRTGLESDCRLDFTNYPNNLQQVCGDNGGIYAEREHSIQCRNSATDEELYYQFDHYPYCFPQSCDTVDVSKMISIHIDGVKRALEEHSGMLCLSDWEILEHANEVYASLGRQSYGNRVIFSCVAGLGLGIFFLHAF
jgi:hypothetical protein